MEGNLMADKIKEKTDTGGAKNILARSVIHQLIDELTGPAIEKIPESVLQMLKDLHVDKLLPILGIGFSGLVSKINIPGGEELADFISEATSELRKRMNDVDKENSSEPGKDTSEHGSGLLKKAILCPEVQEKLKMLETVDRLMKKVDSLKVDGKDISDSEKKKRKKLILEELNKMSIPEIVTFLSSDDEDMRTKFFEIFIVASKAEKTFEEKVAKFKKDLDLASQHRKLLFTEIIQPEVKKFDDFFKNHGFDNTASSKGSRLKRSQKAKKNAIDSFMRSIGR